MSRAGELLKLMEGNDIKISDPSTWASSSGTSIKEVSKDFTSLERRFKGKVKNG